MILCIIIPSVFDQKIMQRIRFKVGDIIEVPLPNGKTAFAHYLMRDYWGDMIGIYDYVVNLDEEVDLELLHNKKYKIFPILTRVRQGMRLSESLARVEEIEASGIVLSKSFLTMARDAKRNYNWKVVGNIPAENFKYPGFIWKDGGSHSKNVVTRWHFFDGKSNIEIGKRLPNEYKKLAYQANFPPEGVVERILTDKDPDADLIQRG